MNRIEKLKEYLEAAPTDSFLQHALALEFIKESDDEEAKKFLKNVLQHDPEYIGSYYHLAKLLERKGEKEEALTWYEKGMKAAKNAGDMHSYNELQMAYDDLMD